MPSHSIIQVRKDGTMSRRIPPGFKQSHETDLFYAYRKPEPVVLIEPRRTRADSLEEVAIAANILTNMKVTQDRLS